ncbi:tetratricopeptide repeat protein [Kitasatospora sp. NPDC057015]|uniref:tetratricopeptide repeat protein n=1 Tax=Kitasatospora sp. NPDC057015 TaxID=3346001 RepID=UPI00362D1B4C
MTAREDALGRVDQHATASGDARIYLSARDQHITYVTQLRPPPQALAALPAAPGHLVGRQAEVDELLAALAPDPPPRESSEPGSAGSAPESAGPAPVVVSAVVGLAGIGKTALALHTAHQADERGMFPGGVLYVTLRGYDPAGPVGAERALGILLRQLGIRDEDLPGEVQELAALYRSELARRAAEAGAVLIVADDASGPAQLTHLVPAHRAHRLLVTSRDTLTSPALRARLVRLDELDATAAAELVRDAVAPALPGDRRIAAEPAAFAEVVRLCGRLPLALQIAAAQLIEDPGLTVATLAKDLAGALDALQFHDSDGRSLAVRAAFDLSHRRLAPEPARLFRLLGLCAGPHLATAGAAALVDRPLPDTRRALAALAAAGLLTEHPVGSGRWRMHDLIRRHTAELADPDGAEGRDALGRLLRHYTVLAAAADDHLGALPGDPAPAHFDDRAQALGWLDAEHPTLVATVARHQDAALDLAFHLHRFLWLRRHLDDALSTAERALAGCRALDDSHREGQALNNLGNTLQEVGRFGEAVHAHNQALTIHRDLGDLHGEGAALTNLGTTLAAVGRSEEAVDAHRQAAALYAHLRDRRSEGMVLNNLGIALRASGRFAEAVGVHDQDLAICRELGDRPGEATALDNLGTALQEVGRFEDAVDCHTRAATVHVELGDRHGEGRARNNLGIALREVGRFAEAVEAHRRDLAICRALGDRPGEATALDNLGAALRASGRFAEAAEAHARAAVVHADLPGEGRGGS